MSSPYCALGRKVAAAEESWKMNDFKECPVCLQRFYPAPTAKKYLWKRRKFCCSTCAAIDNARKRHEQRNPQ